MNTLPQQAEECNAIPTANNDSCTAFDESISQENVLIRGGEQKKKVHSFSKKLAKEIGAKKWKKNSKAKHAWHEATLLKYLANRVRASKNIIGGKPWFYITLDELLKIFPYLGRTTIFDLVMCLEALGYLEIANHNRYKYDRTLWFHVPKAICHLAEEDLVYFDVSMAENVGIVAAVLQRNFDYWIGQCEEKGVSQQVRMSPAILSAHLPCGEKTIKRGLKSLEGKYLHKLSTSEPIYGIPENTGGSNPNDKGSNPNDRGSYPNEKGPYPNNDTYWKPVINPLESCSKIKPLALVFENSSDEKEANDEPMHLLHEGIATFAAAQDRKEMTHEKIISPGSDLLDSPVHHATTQTLHDELISPRDENAIKSSSIEEPKHPQLTSPFSAPFSTSTSIHDVHQPIPSHISVSDADVAGKWPVVPSLEDLHQINRTYANTAELLIQSHEGYQQLHETVSSMCSMTMATVGVEITDAFYDDPDGDNILATLLPYYHRFLEQTRLDPDGSLFPLFYYGALECMVGAFLYPRDNRNSYSHPIRPMISVTYEVYLVLWRRAEDLREKAVEEEFAQWRIDYASVDAHKEHDVTLSPAEKMRVFKNALHSLNKVGWIWYDQTHRTQQIQVNKLGLARIQRLFSLNPDLTPADLLPLMKECMNRYAGQPKPPKKFKRGVQWHARMARRLDVFASYLKTIVKQLGVASPVQVYLSDESPDEEMEETEMALAS